jgi:hypothetical protein
MANGKRFVLQCKKSWEENTDPQRRCYNGCHASSELVWSDWYDVVSGDDEDDVKQSLSTFQSINPTWKYRIVDTQEHSDGE